MSLILSGTNGLSDVDGSAATPAIRGTDTNTGIFFPAADTIAFAEGGVEAMRLDSAGNMGLGVTPSAWRSTEKALQIGSAAVFLGRSDNLVANMASNWYVTSGGTNTYIATGNATLYQQLVGEHRWFNAASGTAGNAITFTQAMTLDASGNLALGSTTSLSSSSNRVDLTVNGTSSSMVSFGTGGTRRGYALHDATDFSIASETAGALRFLNNGSERARIDSSGNLLVATTNSADTAGVGLKIRQVSTQTQVSSVCSGSLNTYVLYNTAAGAFRFYVSEAGQIFATSTSITAISDQTLKENVRDLETGLTEVMALQPRRFDWKNGDATDVAGFIAQEVEQVLPELVTDYVYNKDEEGNDIIKKSLKMGDMLPTLVKAIQEQQALIAQLQADVAALKGNA